MEFTKKEARFSVSEGLFYDLVDRIRSATGSILTSRDVRQLRRDFPGITRFPFGDYCFEFCQSNGRYLCSLSYQNPEKHQNGGKLKELTDQLKDFEFYPAMPDTKPTAQSNLFA